MEHGDPASPSLSGASVLTRTSLRLSSMLAIGAGTAGSPGDDEGYAPARWRNGPGGASADRVPGAERRGGGPGGAARRCPPGHADRLLHQVPSKNNPTRMVGCHPPQREAGTRTSTPSERPVSE